MLSSGTSPRSDVITQSTNTVYAQTNQVVFADDFETGTSWQVTVSGSSGGPTGIQQTVRNEGSGGNPGGFRAMTHSIDGNGSIFVTHIYTAEYYLPSEQGAIVSLNYTEDRTSLDSRSVGSRMVVLQGGQVHIVLLSTFRDQAWSTESVQGLTAQSFSPVPDFSASGDTVWFGYERANTNTNANAVRTNEHGIDNWQLEIFSSPVGTVTCSLEPQISTESTRVSLEHEVTATIHEDGQPVVGINVNFAVISGPNAGVSGLGTTNANGQASFGYDADGSVGTDTIEASGMVDGTDFLCTARQTWVINRAPIARDDIVVVDEDENSPQILVLANDYDPDGDLMDISAVTQPPSGGVLNLFNSLLYTPGNLITVDFTYTIKDNPPPVAIGLSDTARVTVLVDCGCSINCLAGNSSSLAKSTYQDTIDLALLRRFRDEVLQPTEVGSSYVDIYYDSTPEIAKILILDRPDIGSQAVRMVEMMQPALRNLLDGDGSEVFTQTLIDTIGNFFASLSAAGSDSLQQLIASELARVGPLGNYVGLPVQDVINIALADSVATSIEDDSQTLPLDFILEQNYPNPFNPSTTIRYSLSEASEIELSIFNIQGRKIKTLVKTRQQAGHYRAVFDAEGLASGVYFYRLHAEHFVQTRKMLLLQ